MFAGRKIAAHGRRRKKMKFSDIVAWSMMVLAVLMVLGALLLDATVSAQGVTETAATVNEPVTIYDVPLDDDLQQYIWEECTEKGVPAALVLGVIQKESNFKADELGDCGRSVGLMQVQPQWQKARMEYIPRQWAGSSEASCSVLRELPGRTGNGAQRCICPPDGNGWN